MRFNLSQDTSSLCLFSLQPERQRHGHLTARVFVFSNLYYEETVNSVWTNRVAFSYLVAGYLIGVLGDCTIDRWIAFVIIGVLAAVMFLITFNIAKRKA